MREKEDREWARIQNLKKKDEMAYYEALASFEDRKRRNKQRRSSSIGLIDVDTSPEATIREVLKQQYSTATPPSLFKKSASHIQETLSS